MSLLPASADYSSRDFDSLRARLIALVKSVFPDWTDFDVASFGNILLEMFAFVGDVLCFYQDAQARESRLVTAAQRKNVIALARLLGYRLHGAKAATAELVFSLPQPPEADVVIPAGTVIRTREVTEPIRFQLLRDVMIAAGANPPEAMGIGGHSETHEQLFDAQGLPHLDVRLRYGPYLDGSARVSAANGDYEERDSLLASGPNDRHFMVLVGDDDRATLRFGSGTAGTTPTGTINVTYRTGGGEQGNVERAGLAVVEGSFLDAHGRPASVSVTNPRPASGGTGRESIASAKALAPESLRTLTRSVTRADFETNARRVPGVARALMLTSNEDPTIAENSGILFVIPHGGGLPTAELKAEVLRMVTEVYPSTLTFQVAVQHPVYKVIDVEARLFLRQGHSPTAVRKRVQQNLETLFQLTRNDGTPNGQVDFGFNIKDADGQPAGEVAWSDVFNAIRDTDGVRKLGGGRGDLKLNGVPADVPLGVKEFPVLGTVTLLDETGGIL
jgi:hypothetical protein